MAITKKAFILSCPRNISASEVVRLARKAKMKIHEQHVHTVRSDDRKARKVHGLANPPEVANAPKGPEKLSDDEALEVLIWNLGVKALTAQLSQKLRRAFLRGPEVYKLWLDGKAGQ